MAPLWKEAIGSILRRVLGYGGAYLVARGFWTDEAAATYIAAATVILLDISWSQYQKYTAQRKLVTAQAMKGPVTERQVEAAVEAGMAPPTTLRKHELPRLEGQLPVRPRRTKQPGLPPQEHDDPV